MTLLKFNQRPVERTFNDLFDGFFNNFPGVFNDSYNGFNGKGFVPVNIKEGKDSYQIEVVAPGLDKADFKLNVDQNLLTISAEKKNDTKSENDKQIRREFNYQSFKRTFTLDDSIETDKIDAKYENGVLHISLPKKEEVKLTPKEINVQ
jgi:HSP20 family protein